MFEPISENPMIEALKELGWDGTGDYRDFLAEMEARSENIS